MLKNKAKFSANNNFDSQILILPSNIRRHITQLIESSPTSEFICRQDKTSTPKYGVYIIEHNDAESYTVCHVFSYDLIGKDYTYQSISPEQVNILTHFISELKIS
ncbi:hypothetical protein ABGV42_09070 [Paenibacillus pabuli]|uniref:hypothetical protein n=1 Tax=Paenibacillus pabuli TaxID=1472 RepID=UPI0032427665